MARYAAFLRGVSPMNLRMADLKEALESAGFTEVRTVLSSGNALFSSRSASVAGLQKKIEAALNAHLNRSFLTIVRPVDDLRQLLESDPLRRFNLQPGLKRTITFLRIPPLTKPRLPVALGEARILVMTDAEAIGVHVPNTPDGPDFMRLIEKTFGKDQTTRTWDTVAKVCR